MFRPTQVTFAGALPARIEVIRTAFPRAAVMKTIKAVKAHVIETVMGMVFTHGQRAIVSRLEKVSQRDGILDRTPGRASHVALLGIDTCQQTGSRRKTLRRIVHVAKTETVPGQLV